MNKEKEKENAALAAVAFIEDHMVVGLGTGSTAYYAITAIAERVKKGLQIKAVPTSEQTATLALSLGIPLTDINAVDVIDITIDGADEFTKEKYMIKGGGGALLREKIVAAKTKREFIIADASKLVDHLGKFKLPIEVIPFARGYVMEELRKLQLKAAVRPFITDEGNNIIDVTYGKIEDPIALSAQLNEIIGVVTHGLFINLAFNILMGEGDQVKVFS
ncbi:ribose-5-phosphate isomerase RpiA [Chitinophaga niabensis]|uniref:Ribose-5-phosphate isomerase A n=1 Tax=Chitinophaga niabensis TaxID=536979 RepID=A0A1N6D5R2_9BACT|nr:ribose-5-phosphate isomerase RpiA [Chitinophaga niabensis]SIN66073.1 ribose-5-phosphate isomerase [Chitinophaga niabensis]